MSDQSCMLLASQIRDEKLTTEHSILTKVFIATLFYLSHGAIRPSKGSNALV
jgi:hypothetical protein